MPCLLVGGAAGLLCGLTWLALGAPGREVEVASIALSLGGLGIVEIDLTSAEQAVLWRVFVELATRVALHPLRAGEGSLVEASNSLHDFFAMAREQLGQAPVRARGRGRDSAQMLVLDILNGELRPFLSNWHPRLTAALAGGVTEANWSQADEMRRDLEATRLRILEIAWQLGGSLGVARLERILPARSQPKPGDAAAA
jgi:hypothetical protein